MLQSCFPGTASVAPRLLSSAVCCGPLQDFSKLSLLWSMLASRRGFLACQPHFVCTCEGPEAVDAACCSSKLLTETCVCPSHSGLCLTTCRARRRALTRAFCKADLWGQSRGGRSSTKLEQSEWLDAALLKLCYCRRSHEEVRQHEPMPKTVSIREASSIEPSA